MKNFNNIFTQLLQLFPRVEFQGFLAYQPVGNQVRGTILGSVIEVLLAGGVGGFYLHIHFIFTFYDAFNGLLATMATNIH